MEPTEGKNKLVWWIIIIIVVLLILAFVAFYWRSIPYLSDANFGGFMGRGNELTSIEKDLITIQVEGLDSELADIEKEINQ